MRALLFFLLLTTLAACQPKSLPSVASGKLERLEAFPSQYVDPRNVDVWLPADYDTSRRYAVLYMHDGQMLFDSAVTWNKQEWMVDEWVAKLVAAGTIRECIVVGVWNNGKFRHSEYFPQAVVDSLPQEVRQTLLDRQLEGKAQADNYLRFLTEELKPHIDQTYATLPGPENTFIMGSSMGGLISAYALSKYPEVFGGAGCLSTHWPMLGGVLINETVSADIPEFYRNYLQNHLPPPGSGRKIYFDYGDQTLDSFYPPLQILVDSMMANRGYSSREWITRFFPGEEHSERSWSKRLDQPLVFLLGK